MNSDSVLVGLRFLGACRVELQRSIIIIICLSIIRDSSIVTYTRFPIKQLYICRELVSIFCRCDFILIVS